MRPSSTTRDSLERDTVTRWVTTAAGGAAIIFGVISIHEFRYANHHLYAHGPASWIATAALAGAVLSVAVAYLSELLDRHEASQRSRMVTSDDLQTLRARLDGLEHHLETLTIAVTTGNHKISETYYSIVETEAEMEDEDEVASP